MAMSRKRQKMNSGAVPRFSRFRPRSSKRGASAPGDEARGAMGARRPRPRPSVKLLWSELSQFVALACDEHRGWRKSCLGSRRGKRGHHGVDGSAMVREHELGYNDRPWDAVGEFWKIDRKSSRTIA